MTTPRDTLVFVETGRARVRRSGAEAGGLVGQTDILYQRVTIEATARDSVRGGGVVWTRRVPSPTDSGFTGPFMIPLSDTMSAGLLVVERRGDR
jgi:hypothetical protein